MLKIKDNVDLKELEKFGFKPEYRFEGCLYWVLKQYTFRGRVIVRKDRKILTFNGDWYSEADNPIPDLLFKLFQEGLVEKIDE